MSVSSRDFSKPRDRVFFTIDGFEFDCAPAVPVDTLQEMINEFGEVTANNVAAALRKFFKLVLTDPSYAEFDRRLGSKEQPIDVDQSKDAMEWILEVYGLRPTQPSPDSSVGSSTGGGGTSSTAGVSHETSDPSN